MKKINIALSFSVICIFIHPFITDAQKIKGWVYNEYDSCKYWTSAFAPNHLRDLKFKWGGDYKNNCIRGKGILRMSRSDTLYYYLEGFFDHGYLNGEGTLIYYDGEKYVGNFKNSERNGQGTYFYKDGGIYTGQFRDGLFEGMGTYTSSNGNKYVGQWHNDKMNGQGTFTNEDGKYVGQFHDELFEGMGTYTYTTGDKYIGQWKNDKRNGQGTYFYADGGKYTGQFRDDIFEGMGTFTYSNGNKYIGPWHNDLENGHGTMYFPNNTSHKGIWKDGVEVVKPTVTDAPIIKQEVKFEIGNAVYRKGTYNYLQTNKECYVIGKVISMNGDDCEIQLTALLNWDGDDINAGGNTTFDNDLYSIPRRYNFKVKDWKKFDLGYAKDQTDETFSVGETAYYYVNYWVSGQGFPTCYIMGEVLSVTNYSIEIKILNKITEYGQDDTYHWGETIEEKLKAGNSFISEELGETCLTGIIN